LKNVFLHSLLYSQGYSFQERFIKENMELSVDHVENHCYLNAIGAFSHPAQTDCRHQWLIRPSEPL